MLSQTALTRRAVGRRGVRGEEAIFNCLDDRGTTLDSASLGTLRYASLLARRVRCFRSVQRGPRNDIVRRSLGLIVVFFLLFSLRNK